MTHIQTSPGISSVKAVHSLGDQPDGVQDVLHSGGATERRPFNPT